MSRKYYHLYLKKYGVYKTASKAPFVRIPYLESMDKYGSDKPDLRIDLVLQDATEVMADCGFGPFEGQTVKAIVVDGFTATQKSDRWNLRRSRSSDCKQSILVQIR